MRKQRTRAVGGTGCRVRVRRISLNDSMSPTPVWLWFPGARSSISAPLF